RECHIKGDAHPHCRTNYLQNPSCGLHVPIVLDFRRLALSNQIRRATNGNSAPHLVPVPAQPRPQPQEHMERHGTISIDRIKNVRLGIEYRVSSQSKLPMMDLNKVAYYAE